jgi:hypothetical protein
MTTAYPSPDEEIPAASAAGQGDDADEAVAEPDRGDATLPPVADGYLRIVVRLFRDDFTPGDIARYAGVGPELIGPIAVLTGEAAIDVTYAAAKTARGHLARLGPTRLVDWQWRWMRLGIGRNHGLSIGQLRKLMLAADAMPLGKISINNTHSMVGIQDFRLAAVLAKLASTRVNGFALRAEAIPHGQGPGSPAFVPGAKKR